MKIQNQSPQISSKHPMSRLGLLFILGSKSPGRKNILTEMGYKFSVMDPDIDEKSIRDKDPRKLVTKLAKAKAAALLPKIKKPALLITADQVVLCNNKVLEKPKDKTEAKQYLKMYAKHPAQTITATTITNTTTQKQYSGISTTTIWFKPIPKDIIDEIVNKEVVLHCAGGFTLDSPLINKHVAKIYGAKDSITGLPIRLTEKLISNHKHRLGSRKL